MTPQERYRLSMQHMFDGIETDEQIDYTVRCRCGHRTAPEYFPSDALRRHTEHRAAVFAAAERRRSAA